ncbi:PIPOX [Bugula neritina]|uniref:PIPOX n=1 Tax=Bugula neritina TaxID=10212 RepID=A0A7J7IZ75_BUGNE|nr:PIPOX [Bugula neritina]
MYDYIVIGAGVMGSSTAYALAKEGKKVLLLEQFPIPHTRGSSHGDSRITRTAYSEEFNGSIMAVANSMWKDLEKEAETTLFKRTGQLFTTSTLHKELVDTQKTLQRYNTGPFPIIDSAEISKRYPLMSYPKEEKACFDFSAGILYADKCVMAFQKVFQKRGGEVIDMCKVQHVTPGDVVTVHTDRESFQAKGLVITCGAWSSEILSDLGISLPLQVMAIQVCYWKARNGVDHSRLPPFRSIDGISTKYGMPTSEYDGLMKICLHYGVLCAGPDMRDNTDSKAEAKNLKMLTEFVASTFPYLVPEPAIKERCMYTVTPDNQFIVDHHPIHRNIAFGTGFSGHGFKMAPVIGNMLAELVQGGKPELLVDELRASRFDKKSKL